MEVWICLAIEYKYRQFFSRINDYSLLPSKVILLHQVAFGFFFVVVVIFCKLTDISSLVGTSGPHPDIQR